jgi:hypothetical protein
MQSQKIAEEVRNAKVKRSYPVDAESKKKNAQSKKKKIRRRAKNAKARSRALNLRAQKYKARKIQRVRNTKERK